MSAESSEQRNSLVSSQPRLKFGPWLREQLDSKNCPGCTWLNKELGIFRLSWRHSSKPGYNEERDAMLFRKWELHTNRYSPGDPTAVSVWKSRFRNALNRNPDIEEMKNFRIMNSENACRVYRFKDLERNMAGAPIGDRQKLNEPILMDQMKRTEIENIERYLWNQKDSQTNNETDENSSDEDIDTNPKDPKDSQTEIATFENWKNNELEDVLNILAKEIIQNRTDASRSVDEVANAEIPIDAFGVKLYLSDKEVNCTAIKNPSGLRIAYKPPAVSPDILVKQGIDELIEKIYGPINALQVYYPPSEDPQTQITLSWIHCGLFLKIDKNGDIYATRLCRARVYYSNKLNRNPKPLKRREETLVFSYAKEFLSSLDAFRSGDEDIPSCQVFFSFAEKWSPQGKFDGLRVRCSVTHLLSQYRLTNAQQEQPFEEAISPSDELDHIKNRLENVTL